VRLPRSLLLGAGRLHAGGIDEQAARRVLGQLTEARGDVDRVTDDGVFVASRAPDVPGHDVARADTNAGVEVGMALVQLFELRSEPARGGQRVTRVVRLGKRCTEDAQGGVAFELVDPTALGLDGRDHGGEKVVEHRHDVIRRQPFGEGSRSLDVDEEHRHLANLTAKVGIVQRVAGNIGADVAPKQLTQVLALAQARGHPVETKLDIADLAAVGDRHRR
jgi:hypothetical protein